MPENAGKFAAVSGDVRDDQAASGPEFGRGSGGDSTEDDALQPAPRGAGRIASVLSRTTFSPINADRPVFTLSVAADLLGMHPRTLRIYEEEGLVVPARTRTKRRRYSENDIKRFQFIQHLTQRLKVNLAGVRIILEMMTALEGCGVDFVPRLYEMAAQAAPVEEA